MTRRVVPGTSGLVEADDGGMLYTRGLASPGRLRPSGYVEQWLPWLGTVGVHVAVCLAWHGPRPFPGAVVDHEDRDRSNNRPGNVSWSTTAANLARRVLLRGSAHPNATLSPRDVRIARSLHRNGVPCTVIGHALGVSRSTAWRAATGRTYGGVRA